MLPYRAALEEENDSPVSATAVAESSKQKTRKSPRPSRMPRLLAIHDQHALQVHEEGAVDGEESLMENWRIKQQQQHAIVTLRSGPVNRKKM